MCRFERMAKPEPIIDGVAVSSPDPLSRQVALCHQVGDDFLSCPFRDPDLSRDLPPAKVWILGQAHEHVRMVGEERPRGKLLWRNGSESGSGNHSTVS